MLIIINLGTTNEKFKKNQTLFKVLLIICLLLILYRPSMEDYLNTLKTIHKNNIKLKQFCKVIKEVPSIFNIKYTKLKTLSGFMEPFAKHMGKFDNLSDVTGNRGE